MAAVSETIVREFFELNEFFVRQHRKFMRQTRREEEEDVDFSVINPQPEPNPGKLPFVLNAADLRSIERAIVVVKGWHTETFSPGRVGHLPATFCFVEPKVFKRAARAFAPDTVPLKILVVPALPQDAAVRDQSIALLRSRGIDAVIPFHTILTDLLARVETNRNYHKSDLLQILRILKTYDLIKEQQLELFKRPAAASRKKPLSKQGG
jgi:hypothetical protein